MQPKRWQQQILSLSVMGWVSLPGLSILWPAIAPSAAHADVSRADVVLDVQPGEPYPAFITRAETVARAAVQRSFDRDILISEVAILIVGQRQGQSTPILQVQVTRNQWRNRPDTRYWATYLPTARSLLGFDTRPAPTPTRPTPVGTQPTHPSPTSPTRVPATPGPLPLPPVLPNSTLPTVTPPPPPRTPR